MLLIVGLTGTSGAGKGHLCSLLDKYGSVCIIDTDLVYHRMIESTSECSCAIAAEFGKEVLNADGGINRPALASIVFSDKAKLSRLNAIAHAHILGKCRRIMNESGKEIVVIDAPQLFESGFDAECDVTVCVVADEEIRLERIMKRDRITRVAALARFNNQHSDSWFKERCDIVITNNNGSLEGKAAELIDKLKRLYGKKTEKK